MTVMKAINGRKWGRSKAAPFDLTAVKESLIRSNADRSKGDDTMTGRVPSVLVTTVLLAAIGGATYVLAPLTRQAEKRAEGSDEALAKRVAQIDKQVVALTQRLQQIEELMAEAPAYS